MRVLVTRPQCDGERLVDILSQRGIEAVMAPLLTIEYKSGPDLNLANVQAVLLTSANGVRAFAKRCDDRNVLALCVGDATAAEAKQAGFVAVKSAAGDVQTLMNLTAQELDTTKGALLHPAGTHVAGDLGEQLIKAGFTYQREILYKAVQADALAPDVCTMLKAGDIDGVVLYSPRTAKTFAHIVDQSGLASALKNVTAYCLSAQVADCILDLHWKNVKIAQQPEQNALLALL